MRLNPLRSYRETAGLTQAQLAHAVGCSYQLIGAAERGDVPLSAGHLRRLAELFSVPAEDLQKELRLFRRELRNQVQKRLEAAGH
jgi:transcriptional regulator with XRE-family HTH domain